MGGTRAVADGLTRYAGDNGATFHPSEDVEGLEIDGGRVVGVRTSRGIERYDSVISNMDAVRTYRELVGGDIGAAHAKRKFEPACSGVVLYLGLNKRYDHLEHHNFIFSRDPKEEFDAIYKRGEPAPDPTAYVCAPSCTEPGVAPDGGEALYVLVHTPYLRPHHDWRSGNLYPQYRQAILDKLKFAAGMEDIEERIVVERHLTPAGHPRALPRAQRRHLRPRQPRPHDGRVQAGQPLAHGARPLPRRGRRPPRPGHADGHDVRLDRRRRHGPGRPQDQRHACGCGSRMSSSHHA